MVTQQRRLESRRRCARSHAAGFRLRRRARTSARPTMPRANGSGALDAPPMRPGPTLQPDSFAVGAARLTFELELLELSVVETSPVDRSSPPRSEAPNGDWVSDSGLSPVSDGFFG